MKIDKSYIKSSVYGLIVGDALGVPFEFMSQDEIQESGGVKLKGGGTWGEPIGAWSDDSSMALCTLESLCNGYDINDIGAKFIEWKNKGLWTSHGHRFDIGNQTLKSLNYIEDGKKIHKEESRDGNGSLMRILPILFLITSDTIEEQFRKVSEVSSITHPSDRCVYGCFIYIKYAELLLLGYNKVDAHEELVRVMQVFLPEKIQEEYKNILSRNITDNKELKTNGYIISSLEVVFYNFLRYDTFEEILIKTIELGGDTDTNGSIVGGIAGLYYGYKEIPKKWINKIPQKRKINLLLNQLHYDGGKNKRKS